MLNVGAAYTRFLDRLSDDPSSARDRVQCVTRRLDPFGWEMPPRAAATGFERDVLSGHQATESEARQHFGISSQRRAFAKQPGQADFTGGTDARQCRAAKAEADSLGMPLNRRTEFFFALGISRGELTRSIR